MSNLNIAILGQFGGTHVGGSLYRAAEKCGHRCLCFNAEEAWPRSRLIKSLAWRLTKKRPTGLDRLGARILEQCAAFRPSCFIITGNGPITRKTLTALRGSGIYCVNYSTDDPWNPAIMTPWHLEALPFYDRVCTPRHSNIAELQALGCMEVIYVPFGYDEKLTSAKVDPTCTTHDVLFVGQGDADRVAFVKEFLKSGPRIALVGGYWPRVPALRPYALGFKGPDELRALTRAAKINLCLVRRANRDGHVMRSFEIAAIGGCILVEDTSEHRAIFGDEYECVLYFRSPGEAAEKSQLLLGAVDLRERLRCAARDRVTCGGNTYTDRLNSIISSLPAQARGDMRAVR